MIDSEVRNYILILHRIDSLFGRGVYLILSWGLPFRDVHNKYNYTFLLMLK